MIGRKLLHYDITAQLGEGGMGVVYQATDTRLGREVAIKVLPEAFVEDAERLARFQREAQLLASLNHPNIGGIYGLEEDGARRFLVLELIPGETLAERSARGAIPLTEALPIALQLAHALEAAHARGIVHRDLKPANIKLTPDGTVKVLDFGLAKAWDQPADSGLTHSPTLTAQMTQAGVILGTASYMSPEQARGQEADKRADIWSFGVVLFEMLAGGKIFGGETVTDILGAIVHKEPEWERLPANLPRSIERLLERCLEKDRSRRLQDVGDARIEIEDAIERGPDVARRRGEEAPGRLSPLLPWLIAGAAILLALAWTLFRTGSEGTSARPVAHYTIPVPVGAKLARMPQSLAISPDGSKVVYSAFEGDTQKLYLWERSSGSSRLLEGTDGALLVTFSPDGEWIAFRQAGLIRKLSLTSGTPLTITPQADILGLDWSDAGEIVSSPDWGHGLSRVSVDGGPAEVVTQIDSDAKEGAHLLPHVLPGSRAVLFVTWESTGTGRTSVAVAPLPAGEHRVLIEDATAPSYSATGHLLFVRAGTLMAAPFDLEQLEVTGRPIAIQSGIRTYSNYLGSVYDIAADGTLVFQGGGVSESLDELLWVSRSGEATPALEDRRPFGTFELSPDGDRLAVTVEGALYEIWLYDLASGSRTRLTRDTDSGSPSWLPDGREIVFWSALARPYGIFRLPVDGSAAPTLVYRGTGDIGDPSVSPRGDVVVFEETKGERHDTDLTVVNLAGDPDPHPFRSTPGNEIGPAFSPDGHWVAYQSDESGRDEVYVAEFPGPGSSWLVSSGGGSQPEWNPDGGELFFSRGDQLFAVEVDTSDGFRAQRPRPLFELPGLEGAYDLGPDRDDLLVLRSVEPDSPDERQIEVLLNWPQLLDPGR